MNISTVELLDWLVKASYLVAATLFLLGLQRMASPLTARSGIRWAGLGMLLATAATFFLPELHNVPLILVALLLGAGLAWWSAGKVAITDMPQMVALYNGMGGGSAAAIGAVELLRYAFLAHRDTTHWSTQALAELAARQPSGTVLLLAVVGAAIGAVSLSGSVIAWAKLDGRLDKRVTWSGQQVMNLAVALAVVVLAIIAASTLSTWAIVAFFVLALALGVLMTLPIGGADMPVVISLYNAFTGLAVSFEGYVLGNEALIIAGMMVGAAGILLTRLMAKAMNRPIRNVLFSNFGGTAGAGSAGDLWFAEADRGGRRGGDDGLRRTRGDRARLRHGGGAGPAQDLGTGAAAGPARGEGEVRDPSGCRAYARAHERAAGRSGRAL